MVFCRQYVICKLYHLVRFQMWWACQIITVWNKNMKGIKHLLLMGEIQSITAKPGTLMKRNTFSTNTIKILKDKYEIFSSFQTIKLIQISKYLVTLVWNRCFWLKYLICTRNTFCLQLIECLYYTTILLLLLLIMSIVTVGSRFLNFLPPNLHREYDRK